MSDGLLIGVLGVVLIALTDAASIERATVKATDCYSEIYCTGELLKTVQLAQVFPDSKTFVDLHQINDPKVTLANFQNLMSATSNNPNRTQVATFVKTNFASSNELIDWTPTDWTENPKILKRIEDPKYRDWAKHLNEVWRDLARRMANDVAEYPDRHSLIYVPNGFIIPGGRFKEFYYWDSYWVIEGLLLCDMHETVKGMIDNFVYMVEKYGFIPNGGRIYYLMRSQPPMLHLMVSRYLEFTNDVSYLRKILPLLEKEFTFWQRQKMIDVVKNGKTYKMGHYVVDSPRPRPESYKEDYLMAQELPEESQNFFYNNIKAGAESGWDFSNRWYMGNKSKTLGLKDISTQYIIPVELNALLQQNARLLSKFHALMRNTAKSQNYAKIAGELQDAIDNVLWNNDVGIWLDYDMKNQKSMKAFYPTNLAPLYTFSYNRHQREMYTLRAISYLVSQNITEFFGGTPTSLNYTGEQWDFPNAWPPLQSFIVMGLYKTGVKEAQMVAEELASRWLAANYAGYMETGQMFEKYDSTHPGKVGGGGEYNVQEGFGWTNGVILEFLNIFSTIKAMEPGQEKEVTN